MSDDVAIKVDNVSKSFKLPHQKVGSIKHLVTNQLRAKRTYEVQHALKNIDLEIKKGEFFGIVGRNGSGKSTLLKILAGIYQPTKGKVQVNGKLVPFIELGVGFNPELTGRENVYLNGALLGFSEKEIADMYDGIVEFAELEKFMDQKLKNYSSGMQVRLAFSMATRSQADILLIDEVLAVGDADFQRKCFEYFKSLKKAKKTVVFVSHDMNAVREYCDRVAFVEDSELINVGNAEEVAKEYAQLFSDSSKASVPNLYSKRWGNSNAVFDKITVTQIDNKKNVMIKTKISAKTDIQDPTYGFMVSNDAGQPILGTNSYILNAKTEPLKAGRDSVITWQFPNIFNEGKYFIQLVLMYNSITEVADWWEDAATFTITNRQKTPYIVNPPTLFSQDKEYE